MIKKNSKLSHRGFSQVNMATSPPPASTVAAACMPLHTKNVQFRSDQGTHDGISYDLGCSTPIQELATVNCD
jgi:hypothetical protein